jgi:hypothetical protein
MFWMNWVPNCDMRIFSGVENWWRMDAAERAVADFS